MGVWIETLDSRVDLINAQVTPCMGVWIETHGFAFDDSEYSGHTLYGCVD